MMGNQSFTSGEYAQAAVHYTLAIDLANTADSQSTQFPQPVNPILHACYSNRAQCFLKLGQPEKAVEDAKRCTELNPGYCKGQFRYGLALHALGRFPEAIPALEHDPAAARFVRAQRARGLRHCRRRAR